MFLKKYLSNLVFPSFCAHCYASLSQLKILCENCQQQVAHAYLEAEPQETDQLMEVIPIFYTCPEVITLFKLLKNPQNRFLLEAVASLYCLKILEYLDLEEIQLSSTTPFSSLKKKVAKILQVPKDRSKNEKIKTPVFVSLSSSKSLHKSLSKFSQLERSLCFVGFIE